MENAVISGGIIWFIGLWIMGALFLLFWHIFAYVIFAGAIRSSIPYTLIGLITAVVATGIIFWLLDLASPGFIVFDVLAGLFVATTISTKMFNRKHSPRHSILDMTDSSPKSPDTLDSSKTKD